jgi:hypothetical protein
MADAGSDEYVGRQSLITYGVNGTNKLLHESPPHFSLDLLPSQAMGDEKL